MLSLQAALWARRLCFCLSRLLDKACGTMPCESCHVTHGFRADTDLHVPESSEQLCVMLQSVCSSFPAFAELMCFASFASFAS